jgi:branched-chain amino acid transport system permease protein
VSAIGRAASQRELAVSVDDVRVSRSRRPRRLTWLILAAAAGVLGVLPFLIGAGTMATLVDLYTLMAMATMWNLLAGYAGLISVGQQAFIGLGAYVVLVLAQWGLQPYLALPLAVVCCGLAALPLSGLLLRLRGGYFAIATWVVAETIQLTVSRVPSLGGGTGAILPRVPGLDPVTRLHWTYWAALAVVVAALLATYLLLRGRIGLVLTAVRDDEIGARSVGANVGWAKRLVYVIAAAGCGAAGGLLLLSQLNVLATSVFSVQWSAKMLFVVVVGGMGTIEGPILGTIVYFVLQQLLAQYGAWYFVVVGAVAICVALWAPRGLWGVIAERIPIQLFPTGYWLSSPATHGADHEPGRELDPKREEPDR